MKTEEPDRVPPKTHRLPDAEYLDSILIPDFESGTLKWVGGLTRLRRHQAGKSALKVTKGGQPMVHIKGRRFIAARILWWMRERDPKTRHWRVVHLDGDIRNLRAENLIGVGKTQEAYLLAKIVRPPERPSRTGPRELPPVDTLHEMFTYDPEDGVLRWAEGPRKPRSHGRVPGTPAGSPNKLGYLKVRIDSHVVMVHRVVWKMYHCEDPGAALIDHIDMNPSNNRIENLRKATYAENQMNQKTPKSNSSGHKGVSWDAQVSKWKVMVSNKYHGSFVFLHDAVEVARAARVRQHREFANHGD